MYCKQCGKPTNNNQDLCDECLAKQNANNPQDQPVVTTAQETNSTSNEQNNNQNNNYTTSNYNQNQQNNYNQQYNNNGYNQQGYNQQYNNNGQNNYNQQYNNTGYNGQPKSKIAAGILGILLGGLGVHNFYLGYTGKAIAQLLISLFSCGTLAVVSAIWGLVEGIIILTGSINTDANGNPLSN